MIKPTPLEHVRIVTIHDDPNNSSQKIEVAKVYKNSSCGLSNNVVWCNIKGISYNTAKRRFKDVPVMQIEYTYGNKKFHKHILYKPGMDSMYATDIVKNGAKDLDIGFTSDSKITEEVDDYSTHENSYGEEYIKKDKNGSSTVVDASPETSREYVALSDDPVSTNVIFSNKPNAEPLELTTAVSYDYADFESRQQDKCVVLSFLRSQWTKAQVRNEVADISGRLYLKEVRSNYHDTEPVEGNYTTYYTFDPYIPVAGNYKIVETAETIDVVLPHGAMTVSISTEYPDGHIEVEQQVSYAATYFNF